MKEEVQEMSGGEDILLLVWEGGGSEEFTAVRGQITNSSFSSQVINLAFWFERGGSG